MMTAALLPYLLFSACLFCIGLAGVMMRRNVILILAGIELMLNAANINFVAFWRFHPGAEEVSGLIMVLFALAIAAAEAAVGLPWSFHSSSLPNNESGTDGTGGYVMNSPEGLSMIWLIPGFPILAAILLTLWPTDQRSGAAWIGIGAMALSLLGASIAFLAIAGAPGEEGLVRWVHNFLWFDVGESPIKIGWLLDPLSAVMLWMVTFVSLLVLIYSSGYMANDQRMVRFFAFLSLFAGAMLGLLISNHLLVLFMCWEVVGLASYLLIGFWFHKPSAAAACKKAFITTRIGDLGLLLGLLWLYRDTGTLLFYDGGEGCLEDRSIVWLAGLPGMFGMTATATIGILLFVGAMGKSGQFPLHVWLPDAMEGPTPVSALIHAATMVAAGVFLMARIHPLREFPAAGTQARDLITWIGAITALGGALVACAQQDLKRILAFSTISQLGYMMLGLGTGGVAVAMFHLITHAFFKALLFLGAGSVIHGCHDQQDIRYMGGLRKRMPTTFIAYGIGMMALAGFPLVTAGFWSKDLILHAALHWHGGRIPFAMGLLGALLTAFYMTRQMAQVFFGHYRGDEAPDQAAVQAIIRRMKALQACFGHFEFLRFSR